MKLFLLVWLALHTVTHADEACTSVDLGDEVSLLQTFDPLTSVHEKLALPDAFAHVITRISQPNPHQNDPYCYAANLEAALRGLSGPGVAKANWLTWFTLVLIFTFSIPMCIFGQWMKRFSMVWAIAFLEGYFLFLVIWHFEENCIHPIIGSFIFTFGVALMLWFYWRHPAVVMYAGVAAGAMWQTEVTGLVCLLNPAWSHLSTMDYWSAIWSLPICVFFGWYFFTRQLTVVNLGSASVGAFGFKVGLRAFIAQSQDYTMTDLGQLLCFLTAFTISYTFQRLTPPPKFYDYEPPEETTQEEDKAKAGGKR